MIQGEEIKTLRLADNIVILSVSRTFERLVNYMVIHNYTFYFIQHNIDLYISNINLQKLCKL